MEDIDYDPVTSPEEEAERKRREGDYPPAVAPAPKIPAEYGPPAPEADLPPVVPSASVPPVAPVVGMKGSHTLSDASDLAAMPPAAEGPQRPKRSDYAPPEPHGWSKLGHVMASFSRPLNDYFNVRPERQADERYKAATQEYEAPIADAQKEAQTKELGASATEKEAHAKALATPPPKPITAAKDATLHDLMTGDNGQPRINPNTNKPYSYDEAYQHIEQSGQKPEHQNDFEQYYKDYLTDNNLPDSAHNRLMARKQFATAGQAPERPQRVLMMVPQPDGSQKAIEVTPGMTVAANAAKPGEAANATRKDIAAHDKAYVQPADAVEKSYQMMSNAYNDYKAAKAQGKELPTGAESMLALSTHLATTFGNVKGARVTKDMIEHHLGARGISDSAVVAVQHLTNGDVLSPDQWEAFHKLIGESRKLSWQTAAKEADRKHIPVDFLPEDLKNAAHSPEAEKHEASPISAGATATHQDGTKWKFNGGNSADIKNWTQVPTK